MISEFNSLVKEFLSKKEEYISNIGMGTKTISKSDILCHQLPDLLYKYFDKSKYKISGSVGMGRVTDTPWLAIMDKNITESTQKGVYIVFLFSSKLDKLYISLGQGVTNLTKGKNGKKALSVISKKRDEIREHLNITDKRLLLDSALDVKSVKYKESLICYTEWDYNNNQGKEELLKLYIELYFHYANNINDKISHNEVEMQSTQSSKLNIDEIYDNVTNAGLQYDYFLFYRYVFSLLAKPFVILSGLAGSGKTQLALALANCLVEDANKQICFVSVGADWTNREPLLGYPSALDDTKYIMPESGALQIILEANKNPHKPYFLILDEMNLSYVERYFADFLSGMESKKEISLWKGNEDVPAKILLPKNLFITGTINVDETTYMFSPKVLDRANVIEFKISVEDMTSFLNSVTSSDTSSLVGINSNMGSQYLEWANDNYEINTEANDILLKIFEVLQSANAEFGYRTAVEIGRFISIAKEYEGEDFILDDYIDASILQKLLPKLHGSRKYLEKTLAALWELCKKNDGPQLFNATFEDAKEAKYIDSANKILRMYNAANANGFTSFAEA